MKVWQANEQLASWLFIPRWKKESILQNSDKIEQQKLIIDYWMNTDPFASWRRLITALDWMRETELADSIRHNAEPLSGVSVRMMLRFTLRFFVLLDASLNLGSLQSAVSTVKNIYFYDISLLAAFDVPRPVIERIKNSRMFSTEAERKEAGLLYSLQNLPCFSWQRISGVLWYMEEYAALEAVKKYLKHDNGILIYMYTLTKSNYCWNSGRLYYVHLATLAAFYLANKYYIICFLGVVELFAFVLPITSCMVYVQ